MFLTRFKNREEAGKSLSKELMEYKGKDTIVLGIPRGGVVVAYEVAQTLEAPLDLIIPRKIGAPNNPELAIGAVTEDGTTILNNNLIAGLNISIDYVESEKKKQIQEIKRRTRVYKKDIASKSLEKKTVIIVDDGLATGYTMKAAIYSIRRQKPATIIVAVPVGPPVTVKELMKDVEKIICLIALEPFFAIGQFYDDFSQVSDEEVIQLIKLSKTS